MGSSPMLDQAPPQPPDVTGQQGASPFAGVGSMLQKQGQGSPGDGPPGQPNPRGALVTMSDAIKKVLDQMAKMESGFGPFSDRIKSLLDAGLGVVMSAGPQPGASAGQPPSIQGPASNRPGEMGARAPGAGFPG